MFPSPPPLTHTRWWHRYTPTPGRTAAETSLKKLLWLYWILWLTEGALRKWVFPQYSAPLLLVRDPLALLIICYALLKGAWRPNGWTLFLWVVGGLSFFVTISLKIPFLVALAGLRTVALHLTLIFIFERLLTREDVDRIGNALLDLALPMGVLMALQFLSPADDFINRGAGVDSAQLGGVGERIRAPAVFSFISGAAQYFSLVAAFIFGRLVSREAKGFVTLICAGAGTTLAVSVAISRSLSVAVLVVILTFLIAGIRVGIPLRRWLLTVAVVGMVFAIMMVSKVASSGIEAFQQRWLEASLVEDPVARIFGDFIVSMETIRSAGLAGHGLGVGTNMGAYLLMGSVEFLLAEREWERVVLEMGWVLGFGFIAWRIGLLGLLLARCLRCWAMNRLLPLLLLSSVGVILVVGQSGQPGTLGFLVIAVGLAFASAKWEVPAMPNGHRPAARRHSFVPPARGRRWAPGRRPL